jgi:hypothetical protein
MTRLHYLTLTAFISSCSLGLLSCQKDNPRSSNPVPAKKADTHESLAAEATELARSFTDTMASAKDKASATASALKLDEIVTRFEKLAERMEAIGDPQRELKEKVGLMLNEYEKIIAQELPGVIKTFLGNREIGEILQQALENVTHRMGQLAVLDRWKGKATEPDPQATDNSKTETRQVPVPEGNDLVAPPAE